jgi:capsular exopolysaccharide synthesis family protein
MKNPDSDAEDRQQAARAAERRAVVRDVIGRGLTSRKQGSGSLPEQFHYPKAPQSAALQSLDDDVVTAKQPFSDRAEEFRSLRSELFKTTFSMVGKRALAVVSQDEGDGKSYVVANLAVSFGQLGARTLLVDGNLRTPRLHRLLGAEPRPGLGDVLRGRNGEHEAVMPVPGVQGLHFMQAGSALPDPTGLLQGVRLGLIIQQMLSQFDQVLIDTPSNVIGPDARLVAVHAGAVLVVGRKGHSQVEPLRRMLTHLNRSPAVVVGVVLNQH